MFMYWSSCIYRRKKNRWKSAKNAKNTTDIEGPKKVFFYAKFWDKKKVFILFELKKMKPEFLFRCPAEKELIKNKENILDWDCVLYILDLIIKNLNQMWKVQSNQLWEYKIDLLMVLNQNNQRLILFYVSEFY